MSKFKKGDWLLEDDAEVGRDMLHHGYFIHDVLPNGSYAVQLDQGGYELWPEVYLDKCTVEPRCTGWDWVLPEPSNRFGLKVGDKVSLGAHDRPFWDSAKRGNEYVITSIDDSYLDGIARFNLDGEVRGYWHPYWFGLCKSDGSPLPEKPATKMVVLEEWCGLGPCRACFEWHTADSPTRPKADVHWFKTGKTRELEVPNE